MSERGVFAVDRGIWDHPEFASEPFTEREAWQWLIGEAAFKQRVKRVGSAAISLVRGQVAHSLRFMAKAWQWEHTRVRRFLMRLKTATMIELRIEQSATIVTICNYDKYQRVSLPDATPIAPQNATATEQQRNKQEDTKPIETDSEAIASGAEAPDHRKRLFDYGLKALARLTGKGPDACRSFLGKCLKAASDDAITVLGLIEDAERNRVVDPSAWIVARLKPSTGPPVRAATVYQQRQVESREILDEISQSIARRSGAADFIALRNHPGDGRALVRGGPGLDVIDIPAKRDRSGG